MSWGVNPLAGCGTARCCSRLYFGTGTAIIEAKLAQQLAFREKAPLYRVFIDLRKAFDSMDQGRCLEVLQGYGAGPKMLRLIKHFWDEAELACRAEGTSDGYSRQ